MVDTCVIIAPDSALLDALFECDSLGNVYLARISSLQGQRVSIAPKVQYIETDNGSRAMAIRATAIADSLAVEVQMWRERYAAACNVQANEQTKQKEKPKANPWAWLFIFLFGAAVGARFGYVLKD